MEAQGPEFIDFLRENSSALFALAGTLGTGGLSLLTASLSRRQDYSFRLWEKVAERRIRAHEALLGFAIEMRVMVALGKVDGSEIMRTPQVMRSRDHFERFMMKFSTDLGVTSAWQSLEAKREANFVQGYLATLYQTLVAVPSELFPNVGLIIREDLIDLSSSLEKKSFRFFTKGLRKLQAGSVDAWHKYPIKETRRRLQQTDLLKNQHSIMDLSHPAFKHQVTWPQQ